MDRERINALFDDQLGALEDTVQSVEALLLGLPVDLPEFTTGLAEGLENYAADVGIETEDELLAWFAGANFGGVVAVSVTINNLLVVFDALRAMPQFQIRSSAIPKMDQPTLNMVGAAQLHVLRQLKAWLDTRLHQLEPS